VHLFGHTISELFWPGVVLPGLTFALLYAWPFIEARVTHDRADHELLDRPRTRPGRTAIGAGVLTFYLVLMGAGSQDIFAQHLDAPITTVNRTFQVLLFVAPIVVALVTWKFCHDLTALPPDDSEAPEPVLEPGPELELEPARGAPERD
jgi:ubiquinol-cytochrome c reductase cytochrome b subunit